MPQVGPSSFHRPQGLDPISSAELDALILRLAQLLNMTFVIVSHELPSIFAIADRALVLDAAVKTMVALGNPSDLKDNCPNPWVRSFFRREPPAAAPADASKTGTDRPEGTGDTT